MNRRRCLSWFAAAASVTFAAPAARAQGAGSKITRILVGFPPGQATDQVARLFD